MHAELEIDRLAVVIVWRQDVYSSPLARCHTASNEFDSSMFGKVDPRRHFEALAPRCL